jgi:hypothetical protein
MSDHVSDRNTTTREWRLLELLTLGCRSDERRAEFDVHLRDPHLQWGRLLELAVRHKMLGLLAETIAEGPSWDAVPGMVAEHLRDNWRISQHRLRLYRTLAVEVTSALRDRSVPVACTKGIVLASTVYRGRGERYLGDVDLMVHYADGERISSLLHEMGFQHGYVERTSGQVHRHSRKEMIAYRLNPDHLPPFVKTIDDVVFSTVQIDVACSFTWARSEYQIPIDDALKEVVDVEVPDTGGRVIPSLGTEYMFLFTVLHLFREAWVGNWVESGQDLNLMKFGDIIRLWDTFRPQLLAGKLHSLLDRFNLAAPVAWVLVHADRTFGLDIAASLRLDDAVTEDFLSSAGWHEGGQPVTRRGSMAEWLSSTNRPELFSRV